MRKTPEGYTERNFPMHSVESAPATSKEALDWYQANFGMAPNIARVMAGSPALLRSYWQTQLNLLQHSTLAPREVNIVQTVIAHHNRCQYCVAGHTAFGAMPVFNNSDDELRAARTDTEFADPKLNALRAFALAVFENQGRISTAQLETFLRHGYSHGQALDVIAAIAAKVMSNFMNQLVHTPVDAPFQALADGLPYREAWLMKEAGETTQG